MDADPGRPRRGIARAAIRATGRELSFTAGPRGGQRHDRAGGGDRGGDDAVPRPAVPAPAVGTAGGQRRRRPRHRRADAVLVGAAARRPAGAGCRRGPAHGGRAGRNPDGPGCLVRGAAPHPAGVAGGAATAPGSARPARPAVRLRQPRRIVRRRTPGHTTGGLAGPDPGRAVHPAAGLPRRSTALPQRRRRLGRVVPAGGHRPVSPGDAGLAAAERRPGACRHAPGAHAVQHSPGDRFHGRGPAAGGRAPRLARAGGPVRLPGAGGRAGTGAGARQPEHGLRPVVHHPPHYR